MHVMQAVGNSDLEKQVSAARMEAHRQLVRRRLHMIT